MLEAIRRLLGLAPPFWDAGLAARLPGRYVLVGITYTDADGAPQRLEQKHGVVVLADREQGIAIELQGSGHGETYWLPPQTSNLHRAKAGTYRLKASGDVIENPDYLSNWTIAPPDPGDA